MPEDPDQSLHRPVDVCLRAFGQSVGLPDLCLVDDECLLLFEDVAFTIEWLDALKEVVIHAPVAPAAPNRTFSLEMLLEYNYVACFSFSGTIGFDPTAGVFLWMHRFPLPVVDEEAFIHRVTDCVRRIKDAIDLLNSGAGEDEPEGSEAPKVAQDGSIIIIR